MSLDYSFESPRLLDRHGGRLRFRRHGPLVLFLDGGDLPILQGRPSIATGEWTKNKWRFPAALLLKNPQ